MDINKFDVRIEINVVRGGFVLTYPFVITSVVDGSEQVFERTEVFTSATTMKKRIADVLDSFKLTDEV